MHTIGSEKFIIRAGDVDFARRARPQAICHYLQEIASNHAVTIGIASEQMHEQGMAWILCRLQVALDRLPVWHEEIEIQTWAATFDRIYANRDFQLFDATGKPFGRATTRWMVLDLACRRAVRMPDFVMKVPRREGVRMFPEETPPPGPLLRSETRVTLAVRESDVDFNGHANHVQYLEWALEALDPAWRRRSRVTGFDISFLAEANPGEVIVSEATLEMEATQGRALHRLSREGDGREVARAITTFALEDAK